MQTVDRDLVLQAAGGDVEAFGQLVNRYANTIYSAVLSKIHDFHTAEDVAQEVFVKAWHRMRHLQDPDKFGGWLVTIARNQAVDWLRKYRLEQPLATLETVNGMTESAEEATLEREYSRSVHSALNRLSEKLRAVAVMYFISGYNTREISSLLGIRLSAVESRLRRSKEKLKEELLEMADQMLATHKLDENFTEKVVRRIRGLACIKLPVGNLERSVDFYVRHIGSILVREPDKWREAVIKLGVEGPDVLLFEQSELMTLHFSHHGKETPIFELRTDNIDEFHALLTKEGMRVAERYDNECGKYFQVYDPDGNRITIVESH